LGCSICLAEYKTTLPTVSSCIIKGVADREREGIVSLYSCEAPLEF